MGCRFIASAYVSACDHPSRGLHFSAVKILPARRPLRSVGACDTEFLQIAVMNHGQQLAGLRAIEIDHSAEFTIVRAGYTDLAHFLAACSGRSGLAGDLC